MCANSNPAYDLLVGQDKLKSCFQFKKDILVGAAGEKLVNGIFSNSEVKLEVKKDDWAVKSGNIAIEFESRGKPSGILTTQAHFWCHVVGNFFVLVFPVDFLRTIHRQFHQNPKYTKLLGDKNAQGQPTSKAILIPWHELLSLFKLYQPSPNEL